MSRLGGPMSGLRWPVPVLRRPSQGLRGLVTYLRRSVSGLRMPVPDLRWSILGLRGSTLRSDGTNCRPERRLRSSEMALLQAVLARAYQRSLQKLTKKSLGSLDYLLTFKNVGPRIAQGEVLGPIQLPLGFASEYSSFHVTTPTRPIYLKDERSGLRTGNKTIVTSRKDGAFV